MGKQTLASEAKYLITVYDYLYKTILEDLDEDDCVRLENDLMDWYTAFPYEKTFYYDKVRAWAYALGASPRALVTWYFLMLYRDYLPRDMSVKKWQNAVVDYLRAHYESKDALPWARLTDKIGI